MIPQNFIQDLLARVDIVDVVGQYVQLKKGGINYLGLCPFHNEKSPSFTVSPSKQFYHCFGCGAHGSAIGFMMELSGASYVEAIKDLASNYGMVVPEDENPLPPAVVAERKAQALALSEVMTQSCDYYRQQLKQSDRAVQYLKKRGLTGEIAARFGLGYAPNEWRALQNAFADSQAYESPALVESGMVIEKEENSALTSTSTSTSTSTAIQDAAHQENKKRYDRFRDRIMFPIRNTKGQVIGFGGRVIDKGEPKYLNSPETPLFQKGYELYGLFEARAFIRESGYALVTEGYMDVVALAQLGFPNVVATLGTACTPHHVQKLLRQTDEIVFSFDGDNAGRKAARRAFDACLPLVADGKFIKFLFLPSEHDPDSYIRAYGTEAFAREIKQAMPLSRFFLKEVTQDNDLETVEGRAYSLSLARPLLQQMQPTAIRAQMVRELASITQSTTAEIEGMYQLGKPLSKNQKAPLRIKRTPPVGIEKHILRILLAHPSLALQVSDESIHYVAQKSSDAGFMLQFMVTLIRHLGAHTQFATLAEILREEGPEFSPLIAEMSAATVQIESDIQLMNLELKGAIRQVMQQALKQESDELAKMDLSIPDNEKRYRDIMALQMRLRKEAEQEAADNANKAF